ncbi:MAG: hypothetical protein V1789_11705 [PVC group bacterium]
MKKKVTAGAVLFLGVVFILAVPARGRDLFNILRVRTIPNPVIGVFPGDEALEVTFTLRSERWIPAGWSLRYYDDSRRWLGTQTTAYFSSSQNNPYLVSKGRLKGGNVYVALFPLRADAPYLVVALGDGLEQKAILFPYTDLLQDFSVPVKRLNDEISRSDYVFIEKEEDEVDILIVSEQSPAGMAGKTGE